MRRFFSSKVRKKSGNISGIQKTVEKLKDHDTPGKTSETNPWSPPWLKWPEVKAEGRRESPGHDRPQETAFDPKESPKPQDPKPLGPPTFICDSSKVDLTAVDAETPVVPPLANGVDRALFNPGVHFIKDPRTNVYNFTPKIEKIMSIRDFDFSCVPKYVPSGSDTSLADRAQKIGQMFTGSTSSLTPLLVKLHMALSHNRPPQIVNLSKFFRGKTTTFSTSQRGPVSFFLKYHPESKIHSVGADDSDSDDIILTLLGQSMEKMLVTDADTFSLFDKKKSHLVPEELKLDSNAYHYSKCGDFLMRSQLDCHDPRLPGTGMFDLKTRAVCAVRYDIDYAQIHDGSHYQIVKRDGLYESFAREYYELIRTTMFKYSLQARIGRMDGIFIAYHNVNKLFGFEYLPLAEIDKIYHTSHLVMGNASKYEDLDEKMSQVAPYIAENEFQLSMDLLSKLFRYVLRKTSKESARQALNMVLHTPKSGELLLFVKPMLSQDVGRAPEKLVQDETYAAKQDPATLIQHWEADPEFVPPDMIGYRLALTTFVAGKHVPSTLLPRIRPGDAWSVKVNLDELKGDELQQAYQTTMKSYCSQIVTSQPLTERPEDEEELRRVALSQLPSPSALQETLRKLADKGLRYKLWDEGRDKIWRGPP